MQIQVKRTKQVLTLLAVLGKDVGITRIVGYDENGGIQAFKHSDVVIFLGNPIDAAPIAPPADTVQTELDTDVEDEVPDIKPQGRRK